MRKRYIPVLFALLPLVSVLSLSACGGSSGGSSDTTPVPTDLARTTCKAPQAAAPTTPGSLPQGLAEYRSPERGYRVQYPESWSVEANAVGVANITGDAFFTGDTAGKINANVSVTCETVPIGTSSGDFIDAKRTVVQRTVGKLPDIDKMLTVNGSEAASVAYSLQVAQTPEPIAIDKVEVYFADDMGGWTIALTAPKGSIATYRPAFDALVQSYRRP
jgi:hypothetical protein